MASKAKKIFAEYIAIQSCKEVSKSIPEKSCTSLLLLLLFLRLTFPGYFSTGKPGFLHQRSHQGQPAECDALLLRPSAEADIRADGKRLISPIPALRTLLGLNQPKKAQLHLDLILIIKDQNKNKTKSRTLMMDKVQRATEAGGGGRRGGRMWRFSYAFFNFLGVCLLSRPL